MNKTPRFSDDSSERLWLAIAFISSTESCVIGYNAALYKRVGLWLSACQSAKYRLEFSSWCCERSNHTGVIVSNIYKQILFGYFLSFGSCIQNPPGSEIWGGTLNGHDASAYKYFFLLRNTEANLILSGHSVLLLCGHVVLYQHKCDLFI